MMCFFKHSDTSEFKMDLYSKERNAFYIFVIAIQQFFVGRLLMDSPFVATLQNSFTSPSLFWCLTSTADNVMMCVMEIYSQDF